MDFVCYSNILDCNWLVNFQIIRGSTTANSGFAKWLVYFAKTEFNKRKIRYIYN